jgi:murein L,D-transpeptidase YafK
MKKITFIIILLFVGFVFFYRCAKNDKRKFTVISIQNALKDKYEPVYQNYLNHFKKMGLNELPDQFTFIALKAERQLELWFEKGDKVYFVKSYPILAASGVAGPKLKEGDKQVPEGFYKIIGLNANSDYHLSLKVDYPNDFDKKIAQQEGRTQLGGEIFLHGKAVSIGCVAIGDEAIEEVFYMCSKIGIQNSAFLSMPYDFRKKAPILQDKIWVNELYQQLSDTILRKYLPF